MAPRFPDDHQDDEAPSRSDDAAADDSTTRRQDDASGQSTEPLDFGEFVSRSVRSSADRFKQSGDQEATSRRQTIRATPKDDDTPAPTPRKRSPRYWRDSLRESRASSESGPPGRRFADPHIDGDREVEDDGGDNGGNVPIWGRFYGGDGDGPDRRMLAYFVAGLVLVLILILILVQVLGGDDDNGEETPTETPATTEVIAPGGQTPGTPRSMEPTEVPTGPEPTATSEVRRGGDNQLGGDDDDDEGTPEARAPITGSEVASQCTDRCLVRAEADDIANTLEKTGNRPSFSGDGVAWVIASPEDIAEIDADADVALVRDNAETLSLYMLTVPQGGDPALAANYGEVIDERGAYRLVDFEALPARVTTLIDNGFLVHKVMPAPPESPAGPGSRPPIANADAGSLMGQVSDANIRETISTLQQTNAPDGSVLGSRYYTVPGNQMAADYLFRQLESYGLDVWYEDFLTPEGILLVNVVGEVPGADNSAVYAVMAHLDSINVNGGEAAPGADDNSSGMSVTLEIARVLGQYELQHPVRFVFVNAEEVGILGATAWARQANAEGVAIDGVFNVDSVGSARQGRLMVLNSDAASQWLQDILLDTNAAYGLGQEILSRQNPIIVADDNMVRDEGINAVMIARELYGWTSIHHSSDDVIENVSIDNVLTTTYLVLLSVVELAK